MLSEGLARAIGGCSEQPWINVGNLKPWALEQGYVIHSWTGNAALGKTLGGAYAMDREKYYKIIFKSTGEEAKCVIAICEAIYRKIPDEMQSST